MNIAESEQQANIIAKASGSKEKGTKKITYSFIDEYQITELKMTLDLMT